MAQTSVTHITQVHLCAILDIDNGIFNLAGGFVTPDGADIKAPLALVQIATGHVPVARADGLPHPRDRNTAIGEFDRIEHHLHLARGAAEDAAHTRDARQALEAGFHVVFDIIIRVPHVHRRVLPRACPHTNPGHGLFGCRRGFDAWLVDVLRITGHLGQRVIDADDIFLLIRVHAEFQLNLGAAHRGCTGHFLKPGETFEELFLLDDDILFDVFGRRPGVTRFHRNHRGRDIWGELDRQLEKRQEAKQQQRHAKNANANPVSNKIPNHLANSSLY